MPHYAITVGYGRLKIVKQHRTISYVAVTTWDIKTNLCYVHMLMT
jgi:hypothetical protein